MSADKDLLQPLEMVATRELIVKGLDEMFPVKLHFVQAETGPNLQQQLDRIEKMLIGLCESLIPNRLNDMRQHEPFK